MVRGRRQGECRVQLSSKVTRFRCVDVGSMPNLYWQRSLLSQQNRFEGDIPLRRLEQPVQRFAVSSCECGAVERERISAGGWIELSWSPGILRKAIPIFDEGGRGRTRRCKVGEEQGVAVGAGERIRIGRWATME